ncbi:MAG TPA: cyclic nucleotide-binding domain-containing protein [Polyangiaceae bacterium]
MADSEARPMDKALEAWAAGDFAGALRGVLPLLEAQPDGAMALLSTAYLAAKLDGAANFADGLRAAAERAVDLGNLPLAIAGGALARELGLDANAIYDAAATAYGLGSSRIKQKAPPALPTPLPDAKPLPSKLSEKELLERAKKAVKGATEQLLTHPGAGGPLPAAPLFSSLDRDALRAFVEIFEIKLYATGAKVVEEGALGSEAFVVARGELDVSRQALGASSALHLARLGGGSLVGEMALLSRAPRAATVSAACPSLLLVASKAALDRAVQKHRELGKEFAEHCRRRMLDNLVRTSPILRSVNPSERADLVQRFAIRAFEPGDRLVTQGTHAEGLYLIASGEVAVVHAEPNGDSTVVARLGPGEVLGEVALVFRRPTIAEVVAHHPTITLFLPRERFLEAVRAHPQVFVDLYELAARRDEETSSVAGLEATDLDDSILV